MNADHPNTNSSDTTTGLEIPLCPYRNVNKGSTHLSILLSVDISPVEEKPDSSYWFSSGKPFYSIEIPLTLLFTSGWRQMRALWQVWTSFDDRWPASLHPIMQPIIYASCTLVLSLIVIGMSSTYSVYKVQHRSVTIGWWAYYVLTIFYIISNFLFLSLLYVNKRRFIKGCYMDRGIDFDDTIGVLDLGGVCARIWQETVIWAVLDIMVNLVINVMFIYILYRCRVDHHRFSHDPSSFKALHSTTTTLNDINTEDEFQVIDLNK
ncbi:hypothetical protein [Absidia glauca]|uniref:Uncharacterized protein n=1 Tax=Absidia glauca TaxID=4829 RepID=A0A168MKH1_ABSGL|nr:hypothetical protein [Absidia glauca]